MKTERQKRKNETSPEIRVGNIAFLVGLGSLLFRSFLLFLLHFCCFCCFSGSVLVWISHEESGFRIDLGKSETDQSVDVPHTRFCEEICHRMMAYIQNELF